MINRCSNTTISKMRMLDARYLSADFPVEMSLYPLVPLVSSVDIATPPITSNRLSFDFHNIYTVFTLKNRKDFSRPRAASVLHEVSRAFSVASQTAPTRQNGVFQ